MCTPLGTASTPLPVFPPTQPRLASRKSASSKSVVFAPAMVSALQLVLRLVARATNNFSRRSWPWRNSQRCDAVDWWHQRFEQHRLGLRLWCAGVVESNGPARDRVSSRQATDIGARLARTFQMPMVQPTRPD